MSMKVILILKKYVKKGLFKFYIKHFNKHNTAHIYKTWQVANRHIDLSRMNKATGQHDI